MATKNKETNKVTSAEKAKAPPAPAAPIVKPAAPKSTKPSASEEVIAKAKAIMDQAKKASEAAKVAKEAERAERKAAIAADRAERQSKRDAEKAVKAAAKAVKDQASVAARAEKAVAREAKKAERAAKKAAQPPRVASHMKKLDKAAEKLPAVDSLGAEASTTFTSIVADVNSGSISLTDLSTLIAHMSFMHRAQSTVASKLCKVEDADKVTIVSCVEDPSLVGCTGTVVQVRKIHALVDVGRKNPAYVYLSDLQVVEHKAAASPVTTPEDAPASSSPEDVKEASNG